MNSNDNKDKKSFMGPVGSVAMSLCGILCPVGFVLKKYDLLFAAFGASFIIMGISFLRSVKHPLDYPLLLPAMPLIGAAISGVAILDTLEVMDITPDHRTILLILEVSFLVFGISFLISPIVNRMSKLSRCTQAVDAVCAELSISRQNGVEMYCPVWEYYAGGRTCRYTSNIYSTNEKTKPGDTAQIKVDPNDPEDAYTESKGFNMVCCIVGGVFTAAGAVLLIILR